MMKWFGLKVGSSNRASMMCKFSKTKTSVLKNLSNFSSLIIIYLFLAYFIRGVCRLWLFSNLTVIFKGQLKRFSALRLFGSTHRRRVSNFFCISKPKKERNIQELPITKSDRKIVDNLLYNKPVRARLLFNRLFFIRNVVCHTLIYMCNNIGGCIYVRIPFPFFCFYTFYSLAYIHFPYKRRSFCPSLSFISLHQDLFKWFYNNFSHI